MKHKFLKNEFCIFEPERNFHILNWKQKLNDEEKGDISIKVVNPYGDEQVLSVSDGSQSKFEVDLRELKFHEGDLGCIAGEYQLVITTKANNIDHAYPFKVVLVTTERLKRQWCHGMTMYAYEQLWFKQPLKKITGVDLMEISSGTKPSTYTLSYDVENKTLSWNYGDPVDVSDTWDEDEFILYDAMLSQGDSSDGDYIKVRVDSDELPTSSFSEPVIVDLKEFDQKSIQGFLKEAAAFVTQYIGALPQPDIYSTDKESKFRYVEPSDFNEPERPNSYNQTFLIGLAQVQKLRKIHGKSLHGTYDVNLDHVDVTESGHATVKRSYSMLFGSGNPLFMGGFHDRTIHSDHNSGGKNKMKHFWQFEVISGVEDPEIRQLMLDAIAAVATIKIMNIAGAAYKAGYSSESISRDGMTQSVSYTSSAMYGIYSAPIEEAKKYLGMTENKQQTEYGLLVRLKKEVLGSQIWVF